MVLHWTGAANGCHQYVADRDEFATDDDQLRVGPPLPVDRSFAIAAGPATASRQPRLPHRQIALDGSAVT
jgi:hypothetical protein